jgi:hypothetical protein
VKKSVTIPFFVKTVSLEGRHSNPASLRLHATGRTLIAATPHPPLERTRRNFRSPQLAAAWNSIPHVFSRSKNWTAAI